MNLFGSGTAGDGSNRMLRNIAIAGAGIIILSLIAANSLDLAKRNGALDRFAGTLKGNKMEASLARAPKPADQPGRIVGIRYGNVDYTATSSIPGKKPRFKNVLTNPSLGLPSR